MGIQTPKEGQSLGDLYPELIKEWDFENNDLTPFDVKRASMYNAHWICARGHQWTEQVNIRTRFGYGCPFCKANGTSYGEQFIYWSFKQIYKDDANQVLNRAKMFNGVEYDIVVKPLNLFIEHSASYWHEGREDKDNAKRQLCIDNSINLIEIVQNKRFSGDDIKLTPTRIEYNPLKDRDEKGKAIVEYIKSLYGVVDEINYNEVIRNAIEYSKGKIEWHKSLAYLNPEIARELSVNLNNGLMPEDVTPGSQTKVWFTCKEGHNYKASICSRTNLNSDCPYCKNKKVLTGYNDLATTHPELLKEWDYKENGDLKPTDIVAGSYKKVHWICSLCGHKWVTVAAERTKHKKSGCPKCARRRGYYECEFW